METTTREFLNPSSMLTPGIVGAVIMAISNVLSLKLGIEKPGPAYIGLVLSFLFGLLALASDELPLLKRWVLYVLNSLVIFMVAMGYNATGSGLVASKEELQTRVDAVFAPDTVTSKRSSHRTLSDFFISSATAQPTTGWCCMHNQVSTTTSTTQCTNAGGRFFDTREAASTACTAPPPRPPQGGFFRPWLPTPN